MRWSISSDSSSGTHTKRTRTVALVLEVLQRAHHRRQAALHVIGAAALQPVALDARRELLRPRRHHVVMPMKDERRARPSGPTSAVSAKTSPYWWSSTAMSRASSQPLMNPAARSEALDVRRVVGDQALGQDPFVHPAEGSGADARPTGVEADVNSS